MSPVEDLTSFLCQRKLDSLSLREQPMGIEPIPLAWQKLLCYHYTNTADQAVPRIRTWPVFFTERFNKIAEKNLTVKTLGQC